ncbi:MAG: thiamine biosynthesis lipoprotein [Candidatus Krumholzibacteriia bacterium]
MKAIVFLLFFVFSVSPTQASDKPMHREVRQVMGTFGEVQAWAPDESQAVGAAEAAFAVFAHVDSLMSTWNGNSPLSRFNALSRGRWYPVGPEIITVLEAAQQLHTLSSGAFDPTVLPLVKLWGFRGGSPALPDSQSLQKLLLRVDGSAYETSHNCARFLQAEMAVDLGGIAKGYALDQAAIAMQKAGAHAGVLDLGGNLVVFGEVTNWEIAVVDPLAPERWAATIPVSNQAVATSGQYEQFIAIDGQSYGHVLDPRSGRPVPQGRSATVIAPTAIWADGLATALLVMGPDRGMPLIEGLEHVEAVFIGADGVHSSSGLALKAILKDDKPK